MEVAVCSAAFGMNPIQSFHCKLRGLATVLDGETARLLRALDGEDSGEWTRAGPQWALSICEENKADKFSGVGAGERRRAVCCVLVNNIRSQLFKDAVFSVGVK